MRNTFMLFAILGAATAPALAQTTPADQPTEAAKPKMVTKTVCERVRNEATTGARTPATSRVCKKVTVAAPEAKDAAAHAGHGTKSD
jgi:hypothetical protein